MKRAFHAHGPRNARRGSVLVVALLVVIGVAMLGACLLQLSASTTRGQVQGIDKKRAFYLAEAGLAESFYGLVSGKGGNVGSADDPARFGDGVLWAEAIQTADGRYRLESTGLCGTGRATLAIVVERRANTMASLGIFSQGDLVVRAGSVIDSYDSTGGGGLLGGVLGGLLPPPTVARVGSNGNVDVRGSLLRPTRIAGDVTPGPTGAVTSSSGVSISGSTTPRTEAVVLPKIKLPALDSAGDLVHDKTTERVIPAGQHRFGRLAVGPSAVMTIAGPQVIVVDQLTLAPGAKLSFDTSAGDVEIHVTDYVNLAAQSRVANTSQEPSSVRFLVSASRTIDRNGDGLVDPPVTLCPTGAMQATIYAPAAPVTLGSATELFGAITAAQLTLSEGAKLHFDQALLAGDSAADSDFAIVSWRVLELPDSPLVGLLRDPVALLRSAGAVLSAPADSHQLIDFKIRYTDVDGRTVTWSGDESLFDWAKVQTVQLTTRVGDALFNDL